MRPRYSSFIGVVTLVYPGSNRLKRGLNRQAVRSTSDSRPNKRPEWADGYTQQIALAAVTADRTSSLSGWNSPFPGEISFAQVDMADVDLGAIADDPIASQELLALGDQATEDRRREFAAGRSAARQALLGLGVDGVPVLIGERREPLWPAGTIGTITHAEGIAMAAVSWLAQWRGVGLDIECLDGHFPDLLTMITSEAERVDLSPLLDRNPHQTTVAVFAAKEALYKALFPQVRNLFGFDAAHVRPGKEPGTMTLELVQDLADEVRAGARYSVQATWSDRMVLASLAIEA